MRIASSLLAALATTLGGASFAAPQPNAQEALDALHRSDCRAVVENLNKGIKAKEAEAYFWAGRFLDTGACVTVDHEQAARMFDAAAKLGNQRALVEVGGKYGLGVGFPQSYEKAGEFFHRAGIDPDKRSNDYSVGYAGTLRVAAMDDLLARLPDDLVQAGFSGEIYVDFEPVSGKINIRLGPEFALRAEPRTGSNVRRARFDVLDAVEDTWRNTMKSVPPPDRDRLIAETVTIPILIRAEATPIDGGATGLRPFRSVSPRIGE